MKTRVEQRRYATDPDPGRYPYEWGVLVMTSFIRCRNEDHAREIAKLFEPLPEVSTYAMSVTSIKI